MPDSAYLAELLPTKKPHTFAIQVFRQINGEFLDDNEFIAENIDKLIKKIDPDEYHLILPDFLFTNTMVDVNETSEGEVKKYLREVLLPSLDLSKETYELDTFILTQHKGKSKVQLSALEKSLLPPLQKACEEQKVKISNISPLSWAIKAVISLEPSLSTIQMGSMLYLSQHYIGIDQTISFKLEDAGNIVETVKTLRGAEPNIQTMYLLTNALVESDLKEKLSGTLPIQQLANVADEQEGMPAHIKQIIEATAKTLDIGDFPVPRFNLGKYVPNEEDTVPAAKPEKEQEVEEPTPIVEEMEVKVEIKKLDLYEDQEDEKVAADEQESDLPAPSLPKATAKLAIQEEVVKIETPVMPPSPLIKVAPPIQTAPVILPSAPPQVNVVPLGYMQNQNFSPHQNPQAPAAETAAPTRPKVIIKNKSGTGSFLRIVGITLAALFITVGLGVGIGFGLLSYTQKKDNALDHNQVASPVASATPVETATPTPSPSPSPSPTTVAKDKVKILVINATKVSGLAGKMKSKLTTAGYKTVDTGNAKGTYTTPGTFVLMSSQDQSFISTLSKDSGAALQFASTKSTEDPSGAYDVVIVINE